MKEKEDKKEEKALGNEQGLRWLSWEQDNALSLGCMWHSFPLIAKFVGMLSVICEALQFAEGLSNLNGGPCGNELEELK